jgi:hypothetical protein
MAQVAKRVRVVGNTGVRRAFGAPKRNKPRAGSQRPRRSNLGEIIGYTLGAVNPGRKRGIMKTKKKKSSKPRGYGVSKYKKNPGRRYARRTHGGGVRRHSRRSNPGIRHYRRRRNPGALGGLGSDVTNAIFVIVGALGSKLAAQAVLGTNNTGLVGYAANAAAGGILWFVTEKVMHNRAAAAGVVAGTLVQIILRVINDYTPFGSYVAQLGMGDYQMQSFVTPQVLVDPWNSADIAIPPGWAPAAAPVPAALPAGTSSGGRQLTASAHSNMMASAGGGSTGGGLSGGGLYGGGGGGGLYSL